MKKFDEDDGVWRTIGGRRIFIENGQSLSDAMKKSGKFKRTEINKDKYNEKETKTEETKKGKKSDSYAETPEEFEERMKDRKVKVFEYDPERTDAGVDPRTTDWHMLASKDEKEREKWIKEKEEYKEREPSYYLEKQKDGSFKRLEPSEVKKEKSNKEYELYKSSKEYPEKIDDTTRLVTNWKELEDKYGEKYKKEKQGDFTGKENKNIVRDLKNKNYDYRKDDSNYRTQYFINAEKEKEKKDETKKEENEHNKKMLKEMERRLSKKDLSDDQREKIENRASKYESAINEYESNKETKQKGGFYTKKDGTKEYDPHKGTEYEIKYDSVEDAMKDPNSAMNKYIREQNEKKAYKKYLKLHPESEMSFEEFKKQK